MSVSKDMAQIQADSVRSLKATDEERRAVERAYYIRQHAPTILAALVSGPASYKRNGLPLTGLQDMRAEAIEQAGLLFDETEAKP